jgi:predicted nucleic acid-binding protein
MTFTDVPAGLSIFLDANTLISYFVADPVFGPACEALLQRIENQEIQGYTSSHVLAEMTHRLMTIEASIRFTWPQQGIAQRLRKHPAETQQLIRYRQALDEVPLFPIQVHSVAPHHVSRAADIIQQYGLLTNDALIVSIMRDHGLSHLASYDSDFDRVPGLIRYAPL